MKPLLLFLILFNAAIGFAQSDSLKAINNIARFQADLNDEFKTTGKSPLDPKDLKRFKGHDFFPIDLKYKVKAELTPVEFEPVFQMKTTTRRLADYKKYGVVKFFIDGEAFQLNVYQSMDLLRKDEYKDYLFLPFTDLTNGTETYYGGRYIELSIPQDGNEIVIDFNQAYNPYCAYSSRYSCPIVPEENHLDVKIPAGVRMAGEK